MKLEHLLLGRHQMGGLLKVTPTENRHKHTHTYIRYMAYAYEGYVYVCVYIRMYVYSKAIILRKQNEQSGTQ